MLKRHVTTARRTTMVITSYKRVSFIRQVLTVRSPWTLILSSPVYSLWENVPASHVIYCVRALLPCDWQVAQENLKNGVHVTLKLFWRLKMKQHPTLTHYNGFSVTSLPSLCRVTEQRRHAWCFHGAAPRRHTFSSRKTSENAHNCRDRPHWVWSTPCVSDKTTEGPCVCISLWVCVCVFVCVLMDRQMGQSRRTVDEGFTVQLALSPSLCRRHTGRDTKKGRLALFGCVCVCVCSGRLAWQLPWHQVGSSHSTWRKHSCCNV